MHDLLLPLKNLNFKSYQVNTNASLNIEQVVEIAHSTLILHDGPPFANGVLHAGHGVNKLLKDFINRLYTIYSYNVHYVPGWDCHGLPIEQAIEKKSQTVEIDLCRNHAFNCMTHQKQTFQRLGVLGQWNKSYYTMDKNYEVQVIEALYQLIENKYIVYGKRPVLWSTYEHTSLSDAEVEYKDKVSKSIYILFRTNNDSYILVWTTTPWTIPGNKAICYNKNINYHCIMLQGKKIWISENLTEQLVCKLQENYDTVKNAVFPEYALHPLTNDIIPLILSDHVTNDQGTGFVHIAPSYGLDDFHIAIQHNLHLHEIIDKFGMFTIECLHGVHIDDFESIIPLFQKYILYTENYTHSYPHSWRSKKPLIYMLSNQWFLDLNHNNLRTRALQHLRNVKFYPDISMHRMRSMLENRNNWCISRQRKWGIPLMFFVKDNGDIDMNAKHKLMEIVRARGTQFWFEEDLKHISIHTPVMDIMDVWMESGLTHLILNNRIADIYLEGSDQHRGWFQSSLILSVALYDRAPYRNIITHGFILSKPGEKLSKSSNSSDLNKILSQYGEDTFRLFVANANAIGNDIIFDESNLLASKEILIKIRNTLRFIIGNIKSAPSEEREYYELHILDQYILHRIYCINNQILNYMTSYSVNRIFKLLFAFCQELSNTYFDIIKDALYCDSKDSQRRQSIIVTLKMLLHNLSAWLSIFIPFTISEIEKITECNFSHIKISDKWYREDLNAKFTKIFDIRSKIFKILEERRNEFNSNLEAFIEYPFNEDEKLMSDILIVSGYKYSECINIYKSGTKCKRCWKYSINTVHDICIRCLNV